MVTFISAADAISAFWRAELRAALPRGWAILIIVFSLIIGALVGIALRIEDRLNSIGEYLKRKFNSQGNSTFVEGFVSASLIFAVGPLAIMGSISDGMKTGIDQLLLKSSLDFFAAIAFAASLGWGVAVSALPVGIYQYGWTAVGLLLGSVLSQYQVLAMTATGGVLLLGIALRLTKIKMVPVGNVLPAIFLAPLFAAIAHQFI
jgi:uncharacterized membrane protein YqgA involved in biofilm formation